MEYPRYHLVQLVFEASFQSSYNAVLLLLDIQTLRVEHHICGILTGTLPQVGQQNVFLGLPLMLLPEEVVLLVKNSTSSPPLEIRVVFFIWLIQFSF